MKLEEKIDMDLRRSMVEKNVDKLSAIRLIKSAIQIEKSKAGTEITDEDVMKILQKLISQSNDSATQYASGGRFDLIDKELFNITVYKIYLPEQLSENEIIEHVRKFIIGTNSVGIKDMGKVMNIANKVLLGKADMKMVGGVVKRMLTTDDFNDYPFKN